MVFQHYTLDYTKIAQIVQDCELRSRASPQHTSARTTSVPEPSHSRALFSSHLLHHEDSVSLHVAE